MRPYTDEESFLLRIADNPDEDTHKDVYLDWLNEHDEEEYKQHARYIELSREYDSLPPRPPVGSAENPAVPHRYFCEQCEYLFDTRAFPEALHSCQNDKCSAYKQRGKWSYRKWGTYDEKHKIHTLLRERRETLRMGTTGSRVWHHFPRAEYGEGKRLPRGLMPRGFITTVTIPTSLYGTPQGTYVIGQLFLWHPITRVVLVREDYHAAVPPTPFTIERITDQNGREIFREMHEWVGLLPDRIATDPRPHAVPQILFSVPPFRALMSSPLLANPGERRYSYESRKEALTDLDYRALMYGRSLREQTKVLEDAARQLSSASTGWAGDENG